MPVAIQELTVDGFRSFKGVTWEPGRFNLLVGPNGSGKSNLLRLLGLIADVARGRLARSIADAGGMVPLLWDHRADGFGWKLRLDPLEDDAHPLSFVFRLDHLKHTSSYQIAADKLGRWEPSDPEMRQGFVVFSRDQRRGVVYDYKERDLVRLDDDLLQRDESLLSQISDPRTNRIVAQTRRFLEAWRIYHDVNVSPASPMRAPATTQFVQLVEPDGSNLTSVLHTLYTGDRDFKRQIDEGMRAGFGSQFEELVFQPAAAQQIQLAVQWRTSRRPHAGQDLSDGTLRYLFLLTVLASPEPATLIAIDEPEIGLHPSMLPIVAEYSADAARRTQVIITTHSPQLLDAFTAVDGRITLFHWDDGSSQLFRLSEAAMAVWLEKYRLGQLFTSGELDELASPRLGPVPDLPENLGRLPPEDESQEDAQ